MGIRRQFDFSVLAVDISSLLSRVLRESTDPGKRKERRSDIPKVYNGGGTGCSDCHSDNLPRRLELFAAAVRVLCRLLAPSLALLLVAVREPKGTDMLEQILRSEGGHLRPLCILVLLQNQSTPYHHLHPRIGLFGMRDRRAKA